MFKGFSMRSKVIIFIVAAIIGFALIIYTGLQNRHNVKNYKFTGNVQLSADKSMEIVQGETKEKYEEEKVKQQDKEKQVELDQKYQNAFNLFQSKRYYDAANAADDIIKTDSKFYKAYNIKGIAMCYSGNYLEGIKSINEALEIKPDYGYARFNKALALELYGKYEDALQWYDKALEVENYIWSYYRKACIYGRLGDAVDTVKYLKIAIDMDSSVKKLAGEEQNFDNVRSSKEFKELTK